ncbi:hypothetical protein YUWDRAFT_01355 [Streptomyces sp. AmelKG-D3]|nr:hypothetical protein YUWDRAFT_01355 [Streptomyces sp. AmelKG-D3]
MVKDTDYEPPADDGRSAALPFAAPFDWFGGITRRSRR